MIAPEATPLPSPAPAMHPSPLSVRHRAHPNGAGVHYSRPQLDSPEHQLQVIYRTSFDAFFVLDDARRFLRVSESATTLLGAALETVLTHRLEHFTPQEHWPALQRFWADLERRGSRHGFRELLREDGLRTTIEFRAMWNFGPGQHLIAAHETGPPRNAGGRAQLEKGTLTPREREVLQLAADGRSPPEIARILVVSPGTVKTHFQHIYKKLGAHDRASAVAQCLRVGLIA
jgi:PAS domain S-box-containing protein